MKLAVSNIAWEDPFDPEVLELLRGAGVTALEVAPTKLWPELTTVRAHEVAQVRQRLAGAGFEVVAMQALLYGQPEFQLFGDEQHVEQLIAYLGTVLRIAGQLGAEVAVFGSPRNRLRGDLPEEIATARAAAVFARIAQSAAEHGVTVVLEANPPAYGADFVTTVTEALDLVRRVDHPGLRLHLDTACMRLAGDDVVTAITDGAGLLSHVHASEPELGPVPGDGRTQHELAADALRGIGYQGHVSIEMRPVAAGRQAQTVADAVAFVQRVYGGAQP
ncbi:MAG: sugar phosphate isomerase/epimerase [Actinobacteria bacterium]|nr:sugar phosphate isomerase/epimerase [Actinomycetota bacterium]